jgi:hypothetical protein
MHELTDPQPSLSSNTNVTLAAPAAIQPAPIRRSRARWFVALFTTVFTIVATLGIAAFAAIGRAGAGVSPDFLPADSVVYVEARLDLPGDQRDQLAAFLAHFPGFDDQAAFDLKLDQVLDGLIAETTDGMVSYSEHIKPWADRSIGFGIPSLPADLSSDDAPPAVFAFGVTDRAALEATITALLSEMGMREPTVQDHNGTPITILNDRSGGPAYAVTDPYLIVGSTVDAVASSLDVIAGAAPGLAADPDYQAATASLPADRLSALYMDTSQLTALLEQAIAQGEPQMTAQFESVLGMLPRTIAGSLRVDADRLTLDFQSVPGEDAPPLSVRETGLSSRFAPDTLFYAETRDIGAAFRNLVTQLKAQMQTQMTEEDLAELQQVEQVLGSPLESYLDFLEDMAIGVGPGPSGISLGTIATVTDEVEAQRRVDRLAGLVALTAGPDSGIVVTESEVNGINVTTIAVDPASMPRAFDVPIEPSVSFGTGDGLLFLGTGDFVTQAIQRQEADSLAASERFSSAVAAVGTPNAGISWLDLGSAISLIEQLIPSDEREDYDTNVRPFLEPLDYLVAAATQGEGGTIQVRSLLSVR